MRVAVIGCNGYIGKHFASFLLQRQWEVHGYGRSVSCDLNLTRYTCLDIEKKEELEKLDTDVDFVVHFSAVTGTAAAYNDYERYISVNEKGLLHVLDRIKKMNSRARVVFPSSRLVYKGVADTPLNEHAEKEFKTIYALNKWFGEQVLHQYHDYFGIPFTVFRICVPYGNLFNEQYSYGTIGFFLNNARKGTPIILFGEGSSKRTFTHIEDACQQMYLALNKPESANQVYNIAGEAFSLREAAEKIGGKYGVTIKFTEWPQMDAKLETGDTIFDGSRILQLIHTPLKHNFEKWLDDLE